MLFGFLGAVEYLPANIVILMFYVHPLLISLAGVAFFGRKAPLTVVAAAALTFCGLAMAVGASVNDLSAHGLGLALIAAVAAAVVILSCGRAIPHASNLQVVFNMMIWSSLAMVPLIILSGSIQMPTDPSGWLGLAGVSLGATCGTLAFFSAVRLIGTVLASQISNVEPILGIGFAMALLGEILSGTQMIGCVIVVASILAGEAMHSQRAD